MSSTIKIHRQSRKGTIGNEMRLGVCPYCGKRGFYNISRKYGRCQCCGLYRVLWPW